MSDSATVTAAQIARLAGVGRAAVSNWRKRYDDFPQPVGGTATSPTFALSEIESWLRGQGKPAEVGAEDRLWHELNASRRPDESLAEALVRVGLFLQFLDERPARWQSIEQLDDAQLSVALAEDITELAEALPAPPSTPLTAEQIPSLRTTATVTAGTLGRTSATVFSQLLERYQAAATRHPSATPTPLAGLMALLSPHGVMLDPACGLGTLLHAVTRHGASMTIGQDKDASMANLAAIRLALLGLSATVRVGDSFGEELTDGRLPGAAIDGRSVDTVLCEPPFNDRSWNPDAYAYDPRFDYGLPPRSEPELAWVQLALSKVQPGGTVVILLPAGAASRPAGRRIRAELIRQGALREVIGLPGGYLSYKTAPTQIWLLRRPANDAPSPRHVLLVDIPADRGPDKVTGMVLDAHQSFAENPAAVDMPGLARSVPAIELLGDAVDVTPARWIAAPDPQLTVNDIRTSFNELTWLINAAQTSGYELVPGSGAPTTITVAELASRGAMEIISTPTRTNISDGDQPMLAADDVLAGRPATSTGAAESGVPQTEAGDVVLPVLAQTLSPRVLEQGGALLGPQLVLLRLDRTVLDPWFVAGFLATQDNARLSSSQGSVHRIDIKRARLPRLPIGAQQRYGNYFRRLNSLHDSLASAAALVAELAEQSASALTAGTIDLPD
ncbi:N-6 DNA methylase [Actinocatenispora sera]|uniref:N-6 DNA methylase n=1 Tax=Actinocatenispora sera TaxID=390989 RepID=UPI0034073BBC